MPPLLNRIASHRPCLVAAILITIGLCNRSFADDTDRQWSDSTGRFKMTGRLLTTEEGYATIRSSDGKTVRISIARLSKADQKYLRDDDPFDASTIGSRGSQPVDWDEVDLFTPMSGVAWNIPKFDSGLDFEPQPCPLPAKDNFHERMHPMVVSPSHHRAVVGHTVTFSVPKPISRLSILDLKTGKSIHSENVEAAMRPVAITDGGNSVVMLGSGRQRDRYETPNQLQVWKLTGRNVTRSDRWIPYPDEETSFGRKTNGEVVLVRSVGDQKLLTVSKSGHLVVWNTRLRRPLWHSRLGSRNFDIDLSVNQNLLALMDGKTLMVVDIERMKIVGSVSWPSESSVGWSRVRWGPSGKNILVASMGELRVLDTATGKWIQEISFAGKPIATQGLGFPDQDYVLLNDRSLFHIPSRIQVCDYSGAQSIELISGVCFVAVQESNSGLVFPTALPHPSAVALLEKAKSDPSLFLVHPGVGVAIDVTGVEEPHRQTVEEGLRRAAKKSGYTIDPTSSITIAASISGPTKKRIKFIAGGSYLVTRYSSTIKIQWNGTDLWTKTGSNIPGIVSPKRGKTMQERLEQLSKRPNTSLFGTTMFPKFIQKPADRPAGKAATSPALMTSKFTLQGLVD